jgi:hypothetical protein
MKEFVGKIGFQMKPGQEDFIFKYSLNLTPANLNRQDATGFSWKLTVEIYDNVHATSMNAFNIDKRTLGISEEQAKAKIMNAVKEEITGNLYTSFIKYISTK